VIENDVMEMACRCHHQLDVTMAMLRCIIPSVEGENDLICNKNGPLNQLLFQDVPSRSIVTVVLPLIATYPTKSSCVIEGLVLRQQEGRGIGNPHVDVMYRVSETICVSRILLNGAHSLMTK